MKNHAIGTFTAVAAAAALFFSSGAMAASTVNVSLWNDGTNMAIKLDKTTVPAGKVTFDGKNTSTDDTVHEMLIIKVDSKLPNLPYDANADVVPEDKIDSLGEISEIKPGQEGKLTLDLKPGTYLLFCNQPEHFALHMETLFFVS